MNLLVVPLFPEDLQITYFIASERVYNAASGFIFCGVQFSPDSLDRRDELVPCAEPLSAALYSINSCSRYASDT